MRRPAVLKAGRRPLGLAAALSLAALLAAGASQGALAAQFLLSNGESVSGEVAQIGDEHVSVRDAGAYRLLKRTEIRTVVITRPDGARIAGPLLGWAEGYYRLQTTRGEIVIDGNGIAPPVDGRPREEMSVAGDDVVARATVDGRPSIRVPLPPLAILEGAVPQPTTPLDPSLAPTPSTPPKRQPEPARPAEPAPRAQPAPAATPPASAPAPQPATPKPQTAEAPTPTPEPEATPEVVASAAAPTPPASLGAGGRSLGPPLEPSAPLSADERRALLSAYASALEISSDATAPTPASCAQLVRLADAPRAAFDRSRPEPGSVVFALGSQTSLTATEKLTQAFFYWGGSESDVEAGDNAALISRRGDRLSLPDSVSLALARDRVEAIDRLARGAADLALTLGAPLNTSAGLSATAGASRPLADNERLIAFDAIAVAASPDSPIRALSPDVLASVLSGKIDDWSMIDPTRLGRPRVYLPRQQAGLLKATLDYLGLRQARPAEPYYVDRAEDRLEAVLKDPEGIALVSWSVLRAAGREDAAVALGRGSAAIAPSLDAIRSARYPLILPVKLRLSDRPALPGARQLAAFLSGPKGQRAIYNAGLAPVAACDPSTCSLQTPGLDQARLLIRDVLTTPPKAETISTPPVVQRTHFETRMAPAAAASEADRADLAAFLTEPTALGPLTVLATPAADESEASAALRAEAAMLALRCAGKRVERGLIDLAAPPEPQARLRIVEE